MFTQVVSQGRRYYLTPRGALPSVTSVLSATKSEADKAGLAKWRAEEPDADAIMADALERGTALHKAIEDWLRTGQEGSGPWWASVWPYLQRIDRTQPMLIEHTVASPAGYAGALDLAAVHDDVETVHDWKTARKKKRPEYVLDYKLQVAAYTAALNFERIANGLAPITRAVVVVAYENALADTFELNRSELIATYQVFLQRLDAFKKLSL